MIHRRCNLPRLTMMKKEYQRDPFVVGTHTQCWLGPRSGSVFGGQVMYVRDPESSQTSLGGVIEANCTVVSVSWRAYMLEWSQGPRIEIEPSSVSTKRCCRPQSRVNSVELKLSSAEPSSCRQFLIKIQSSRLLRRNMGPSSQYGTPIRIRIPCGALLRPL